jgi:two-component system, OmpR family, sensor histidine kinase TctE
MPWNWIRRASLQARLFALLWPIMALLMATSWWFTRTDAVASANAAYDRSLLGAIKALDLNVSTASGGLAVELPYRLFEFFELTATGNVYFRVATADGLVEIGSPDLPTPPNALKVGIPQFYDANYFGESVRVGVFMRKLEQSVGQSNNELLVIQVAESTASRQAFTDKFVRQSAMRDVVLLFIMSGAVIIALAFTLRPIKSLAVQTQARAPEDLSPLQVSDIPSDIRPLVQAINQQLERTESLITKRQRLIDDASHQLRTPLTVLRAQLDFARRELNHESQQSALKALSEELDHAIRATNQLLTLARQDAARPEFDSFDLAQLAREASLELLPLARSKQIDLGIELPNTPIQAEGDAAMLHQALINLIHNAIQHGKPAGVITVKPAIELEQYVLKVIDDGKGIDPEVLPRIGQRFAKSRTSKGSGLGLAIALTAIEYHGGKLVCETLVNKTGNCVTLQWPKVQK